MTVKILVTIALLSVYGVLPSHSYQTSVTSSGELLVHCTNGADATVRPVSEFGSIVVSCGK
jgi:hypothetical protein